MESQERSVIKNMLCNWQAQDTVVILPNWDILLTLTLTDYSLLLTSNTHTLKSLNAYRYSENLKCFKNADKTEFNRLLPAFFSSFPPPSYLHPKSSPSSARFNIWKAMIASVKITCIPFYSINNICNCFISFTQFYCWNWGLEGVKHDPFKQDIHAATYKRKNIYVCFLCQEWQGCFLKLTSFFLNRWWIISTQTARLTWCINAVLPWTLQELTNIS